MTDLGAERQEDKRKAKRSKTVNLDQDIGWVCVLSNARFLRISAFPEVHRTITNFGLVNKVDGWPFSCRCYYFSHHLGFSKKGKADIDLGIHI